MGDIHLHHPLKADLGAPGHLPGFCPKAPEQDLRACLAGWPGKAAPQAAAGWRLDLSVRMRPDILWQGLTLAIFQPIIVKRWRCFLPT